MLNDMKWNDLTDLYNQNINDKSLGMIKDFSSDYISAQRNMKIYYNKFILNFQHYLFL